MSEGREKLGLSPTFDEQDFASITDTIGWHLHILKK